MKKILAVLLSLALLPCSAPVLAKDSSHMLENTGRGIVAVKSGGGIFISWRLQPDEADGTGFILFRDSQKIAYITDSTNYFDPNGDMDSEYSVSAVTNGTTSAPCDSVRAFASGSNYFDIPLDIPPDAVLADNTTASYSAGDASCGDLDGDGEYELIIKWNANPHDNSQSGYTGNVLLDAYTMRGEKLWRIDLGPNIRAGEHYTQFIVRDLDNDGIAEVAMKTAPGSVDSSGTYVSAVSLDSEIRSCDNLAKYVNSDGRVLDGPEFYTVFDGKTGLALDTVKYPFARGDIGSWGDTSGNRVDRFLACSASLDGKNMSVVTLRGYYGRTTACAYNLVGKRLLEAARFDTNDSGMAQYAGQGNHNITVADVDSDGCDEIITGSLCLDNDLTPLWCGYRGHGDALHISDYDPTHPGLEYFTIHESGEIAAADGSILDYGMTVYDAATGETLFHTPGSNDTARGIMANVGAGGFYQFWASQNAGSYACFGSGEYRPVSVSGASMNSRVFWDGDLYDELLDSTSVTAWNGSGMSRIFTATGCTSVNGTKAVPALSADLFGDWREELVYPTTDNSALRVFTTDILTGYKLPTLMSDPVYRNGVAAENVAYNQPPHIGYYPLDYISVTPPENTVFRTGEQPDFSGAGVTAHYVGSTQIPVQDFEITGYDPFIEGTQEITVTYNGKNASFTAETKSGLIIESGAVCGISDTDEYTFVIPAVSGGTSVKSILAGAFPDPAEITVPSSITDIAEGAFSQDCVLIAEEDSAAYEYAINHGLLCITGAEAEKDFIINEDFSAYAGFSYLQKNTAQSAAKNGMIFTIPARESGGDGYSGFRSVTENSNTYLEMRAGRFSNASREPSITFTTPLDSNTRDSVLSMRIRFRKRDTGGDGLALMCRLSISGSSEITSLSPDRLGINTDEWYEYRLINHSGVFYEALFTSSGEPIFLNSLSAVRSDSIKKLSVLQYTGGGYSSSYTEKKGAVCDIDNLRLYYTDSEINSAVITAVDEGGTPIPNCTVTVGKITASSELTLASGSYSAQVFADGFISRNITLNMNGTDITKTVTLEKLPVSASGISLDRTEITLKKDDFCRLSATALPEKAQISDIEWHSDNPETAIVSDGVVIAVSAGEATVTATANSGEFNASCLVTVSENPAAAIEITTAGKLYCTDSMSTKSKPYALRTSEPGAEVTYSITPRISGASVSRDGIITILPSCTASSLTLRAALGSDRTVYDSCTINIEHIKSISQIAAADFSTSDYSGFSLMQSTQDLSQTIGGITYGVGSRSGNGDRITGFLLTQHNGSSALHMRAGQYSGNGRNAYILLPDTGAMNDGKIYTLSFDFEFENNGFSPIISICDSTTADRTLGKSVGAATSARFGADFKPGTRYNYTLKYQNNNVNESLFDANGKLIWTRNSVTAGDRISKISLNSLDYAKNAWAGVYFYNISLTSCPADEYPITISVMQDGTPAENEHVQITCGKTSFDVQTNSKGIAHVCVPYGLAAITVRGKTNYASAGSGCNFSFKSASAKAFDAGETEYILIYTPENIEINTYYASYSDTGALSGIQTHSTALNEGEHLLTFQKDSDSRAVYFWNADFKPLLQKLDNRTLR